MIKWYFSKWEAFFAKYQQQLDLSEKNMNRATLSDYWVMFKMISSPGFILLMLPLTILAAPFILLFSVFEWAFALLVVGSIFAAPISIGMIVNGQSGWKLYLVAVISTTTVLLRYLILPLLNRSRKFKRFKKRIFRVR